MRPGKESQRDAALEVPDARRLRSAPAAPKKTNRGPDSRRPVEGSRGSHGGCARSWRSRFKGDWQAVLHFMREDPHFICRRPRRAQTYLPCDDDRRDRRSGWMNVITKPKADIVGGVENSGELRARHSIINLAGRLRREFYVKLRTKDKRLELERSRITRNSAIICRSRSSRSEGHSTFRQFGGRLHRLQRRVGSTVSCSQGNRMYRTRIRFGGSRSRFGGQAGSWSIPASMRSAGRARKRSIT